MYPNNPALNQQMALLDQEYAQKKNSLMQNFYNQMQQNNWGQQSAQPMPSQPTPSQNVDWVYVAGVDGAKNQIVQPGQTAWMMDNNDPYIYVKSVDKFGSPEFHTFFIQEVPEDQINRQTNPIEQPKIDLSGYVQRDEFERFKEQMEQLTIASKKQPVKANKGVEDNG